jgi:hypothetical protein
VNQEIDRVELLNPRVTGKLRLMQVFVGGGELPPPECDIEGCRARAKVLLADDDNKGFSVCMRDINASPLMSGVVKQGACNWCKDVIGEPHSLVWNSRLEQNQPKSCATCESVRITFQPVAEVANA